MRRINLLLKRLEFDKAWEERHNHNSASIEHIDAQIAEQQKRFDHLAGVPVKGDCK